MVYEGFHAALQVAAQEIDRFSTMIWQISGRRFHARPGSPGFGETSFTEWLLVSLESQHVIQQYQFNQAQEPRLGADWEWWIGSDRIGWRCARLQAKRAYSSKVPGRPTYSELGHIIGRAKPDSRQIDRLIAYSMNGTDAETLRPDPYLKGVITPYYVFYNGWPASEFPSRRDFSGVAANECEIARHATRRTDHPRWGDWAVQLLHHLHTCDFGPPSDLPRRWHDDLCQVPRPEFSEELLHYWGASTMPAVEVRARLDAQQFRTVSPVTDYLGASLPLSTVLFDQWAVLSYGDETQRRRRLPYYASAIRQLTDPDESLDAVRMLAEMSTTFGIPRVAVTDLGP